MIPVPQQIDAGLYPRSQIQEEGAEGLHRSKTGKEVIADDHGQFLHRFDIAEGGGERIGGLGYIEVIPTRLGTAVVGHLFEPHIGKDHPSVGENQIQSRTVVDQIHTAHTAPVAAPHAAGTVVHPHQIQPAAGADHRQGHHVPRRQGNGGAEEKHPVILGVIEGKGSESGGDGEIFAQGPGGQGGGEQPVAGQHPKGDAVVHHGVEEANLGGAAVGIRQKGLSRPGQGAERPLIGGVALPSGGCSLGRGGSVRNRGKGGGYMGDIPTGHTGGEGSIHGKKAPLSFQNEAMGLSHPMRFGGKGKRFWVTAGRAGKNSKNLSLTGRPGRG